MGRHVLFQATRLQKATTKRCRIKVQMPPLFSKATAGIEWKIAGDESKPKELYLKKGKKARVLEETYLGCVQYLLSSKPLVRIVASLLMS